MFNRLIERKKFPAKAEDTFDITLFEEQINCKNNRYYKNMRR